MTKPIDHEYTRNITCPHCWWEDRDSWDHHLGDGDSVVTECGKCEKQFRAVCHVSVDYSTEKIEEEKGCTNASFVQPES